MSCCNFFTRDFSQLKATENSVYLDMLWFFAYGTWSDYTSKPMDLLLCYFFPPYIYDGYLRSFVVCFSFPTVVCC